MAVLQTQVESSVPEVAKCKNMIITYEPVLAIETGLLPANEEIQSIHFVIYGLMGHQVAGGKIIPVLYGGSVKISNAAEVFALQNVDVGLLGGALLKASDFIPIIEVRNRAEK